MDRFELEQQLTDQIPDLKRRQCTPRVMAMADALLDQYNEVVEAERTAAGDALDVWEVEHVANI